MFTRTRKLTNHPPSRDLGAGLLFLCALLVFVPNLSGYFLSDDFVLLSWTQAHSPGDVIGFFDPNTTWFYRPGVKVIYWLGQSAFGLHAAPFHLFSLLLHGANGYLVYLLVAQQMRGSTGWMMGLAAGLLFLLNLHHAETVSWIAAVGDLAATFCVLSALLLALRYRETERLRYLLMSLSLFTIGLFTRETVVVLPVLLTLALLVFQKATESAPQQNDVEDKPILSMERLRRFMPFAAYSVPLLLYFAVQALGRSGGSTLARGGLKFLPLNPDSVALGVMDYVHGLVPGGSFIAGQSLYALRAIVWVELAVITLLAIALWRVGWRLALFGLGWLMLTPLLFVFFNAPTDRYFYLPSVGYAILTAALLVQIPRLATRLKLSGSWVKLVTAALGVALLLSEGLDLLVKEGNWHTAGQVSGGVYNDVLRSVPIAPRRANFYFVHLPLFLNGVPTFQNALPQALQLLYGDSTLSATLVTCEQLAGAQLPRFAYFFRTKEDGAEQFAGAEGCAK